MDENLFGNHYLFMYLEVNLFKLKRKQTFKQINTIRRRGEKILGKIAENKTYKTIWLEVAGLKKRTLKVRDGQITLPGYKDSNGRKLYMKICGVLLFLSSSHSHKQRQEAERSNYRYY